jgi:hypothetical protein
MQSKLSFDLDAYSAMCGGVTVSDAVPLNIIDRAVQIFYAAACLKLAQCAPGDSDKLLLI